MDHYISLTAYWAAGCGESKIEISLEEWEDIRNGKEIGFESDSWYDGEQFDVNWCFNEKKLNIYEAEAHRVVDCPLSELVIFLHNSPVRRTQVDVDLKPLKY